MSRTALTSILIHRSLAATRSRKPFFPSKNSCGISTNSKMNAIVTTTVLYPQTKGKRFDLDYYMKHHLPYAEKVWGPMGMKDWAVVTFKDDASESLAPYRLKTVSQWTSLEAIKKATTSAEGKPVLDDAANFTDEVPVLLVGETVGTSNSA